MKLQPIHAAALLILAAGLLAREEYRGAFAAVDRAFLAWTSANTKAAPRAPAVTLVRYDEESVELAGSRPVAPLDAALFVRTAARLGARLVAVEGLPPDAGVQKIAGLVEHPAAPRLLLGYMPAEPPGGGWTTIAWPPRRIDSLPELAGAPMPPGALLPAGFVGAPRLEDGALRAPLLARTGDHAVPSLLLLAWLGLEGDPPLAHMARDRAEPVPRLPIDARGGVMLLPARTPPAFSSLSFGDFLLEAEKIERGAPPDVLEPLLRGRFVLLGRTSEGAPRVAVSPHGEPVPLMEAIAQAWTQMSHGRAFGRPSWFYPAALSAGCVLLMGILRRQPPRYVALAGIAAVGLFLLAAPAFFAATRLLLLPVTSVVSILLAAALARLARPQAPAGR